MDICELITSGSDERIYAKENGLNKYLVHPCVTHGAFTRGSCTCSPFNDGSKAAANELLKRIEQNGFEHELKDQVQRLKNFINYKGEDKAEVFLAPSGSFLCYLPLLFSKILEPQKPIYNIITCTEELGSGSKIASEGKYFNGYNQFGDPVEKEGPLPGDLDITVKALPARDKDGNIFNPTEVLLEEIEKHKDTHTVIANLVIGSKSGIEDNIKVINQAPEGVMWVVDVCQLRVSQRLINYLLDRNCMIMVTGSKFYQAPPFCGALLVPHPIVHQLNKGTCNKEVCAPFKEVFSKYDFPEKMDCIRNHFKPYENIGIALRWECALYEMNKLSQYTTDDVVHIIDKWFAFVVKKLNESSDIFEFMPGIKQTNNSIISFRMKHADGTYFSEAELKSVYERICLGEFDGFKGYTKATTGQPVSYGDKSFIRLALGSYNARLLLESGYDFHNDGYLIDILKKFARS